MEGLQFSIPASKDLRSPSPCDELWTLPYLKERNDSVTSHCKDVSLDIREGSKFMRWGRYLLHILISLANDLIYAKNCIHVPLFFLKDSKQFKIHNSSPPTTNPPPPVGDESNIFRPPLRDASKFFLPLPLNSKIKSVYMIP